MRRLLTSGIPELFLLSLAFILGDGERFAAIAVAALIHEGAHVLTAFLLKIPLRLYRTEISGISMKYDFSTSSPICEVAVCLAGPVAGMILFLICRHNGSMSYLAGATAVLSVFNLLPISELDGGCALSAFLSLFFHPDTVFGICKVLSVTLTLLLWFVSVYLAIRTNGDLSVMAVSVYLIYRLFSKG